jgi:hypothetical protein
LPGGCRLHGKAEAGDVFMSAATFSGYSAPHTPTGDRPTDQFRLLDRAGLQQRFGLGTPWFALGGLKIRATTR